MAGEPEDNLSNQVAFTWPRLKGKSVGQRVTPIWEQLDVKIIIKLKRDQSLPGRAANDTVTDKSALLASSL